jgi:hypothetical protein
MAVRADIEFTYTSIDRIFRLSLGELADFSGARDDQPMVGPYRRTGGPEVGV